MVRSFSINNCYMYKHLHHCWYIFLLTYIVLCKFHVVLPVYTLAMYYCYMFKILHYFQYLLLISIIVICKKLQYSWYLFLLSINFILKQMQYSRYLMLLSIIVICTNICSIEFGYFLYQSMLYVQIYAELLVSTLAISLCYI